MTKREIASLACKILAVYALLQLPQYVQGIYFLLSGIFAGELWGDNIHRIQSLFWSLSTVFVPMLLYLVVGILLWRRSDALASRMVSDEQTGQDQCRLPGREFMAIAFSIVGLVVLVHAMPRIAHLLARLVYRPTLDFPGLGGGREWDVGTIAQLAAMTVQVILGAVLLVGGRALSQLVMKIRTAGLNDKDQNHA